MTEATLDLPPMRLFDSRRRRVVDFASGRTVRLYVCGITPYDASHLGHAFTYTAFDVLERVLTARGHRVITCRNVTDVDDDIIRTARERQVDVAELADRETRRFQEQMSALGLRDPAAEPRVSGTIDAIVMAVAGLVHRGHAYALDDGRVYLDTGSLDGAAFGALVDLEDDERRRRYADSAGDPDAPGKRQPLDLLLWQPKQEADEPSWPSPWGEGRPGWHIECSVMAMEELGPTIDLHGGGRDLAFPHHEAEILQSELLTGQRPFARFWLHTGMVRLDDREMAKSLGNLVDVGDLLTDHPAGAVRRYLLEHHYRSDWDHDPRALAGAVDAHARWCDVAGDDSRDGAAEREMHDALADDLDTPRAIAALDDAARAGAGASVARGAALLGIHLDQRRRVDDPARGTSR